MTPRSYSEIASSLSEITKTHLFHCMCLTAQISFAHKRSPHYCSHITQSDVNFMPH